MATVTVKPLGISLPIRSGNNGFFEQTYNTLSQKRANIINLLKTKVGERRMQPTFGSRLWSEVFEQHDQFIPQSVETIIKEDVSKWVDGVVVKNVTVKVPKITETQDSRDIYKLYIEVEFVVIVTQEESTINLILNGGKI